MPQFVPILNHRYRLFQLSTSRHLGNKEIQLQGDVTRSVFYPKSEYWIPIFREGIEEEEEKIKKDKRKEKKNTKSG